MCGRDTASYRRTVAGFDITRGWEEPRPRCGSCGEPLGVYEPLIHDDEDRGPTRTSLLRLAEHAATAAATGTLFHAACHAARGG